MNAYSLYKLVREFIGMLLLGVDIGTTGAKALVFNEAGSIVAYSFKEFGIYHPQKGYAEQDPELVWAVCKQIICEATAKSGPNIAAISISVQGDAIIPVGLDRKALANAQLGMDYRGVEETEECAKIFGEQWLFDNTGMRPHPLNSLIKILWIKKKSPDLFEKTYKFVTFSDFLLAKLGSDEYVIDLSMASRTMAFDLKTCYWSEKILGRIDIPVEKLSKPVPSATAVGKISERIGAELGINSGALIVAGGHDQACAALGSGIIKPSFALDSHGTAEVLSTPLNEAITNSVMFNSYYPCYSHVVPGMYFTFGLNHVGGVLLKWLSEQVCGLNSSLEGSPYDYLLNNCVDKPSHLMVLPHFNGSGTPTCDLESKGAILGLNMSTNRFDIAKAIMEALSFELRININTMLTAGIQIENLICVGGGARSKVILQNKADILSIPVSTLQIREAAGLGAGMLAGLATGAFGSVREAANIVKTQETYYPREEYSRCYEERFSIYKMLYPQLKNVNSVI